MPYKEKCGFRNRVLICKFREEDCTPEKCDFHDLPFTSRDIRKRMNEEHVKILVLQESGENRPLLEDKVKGWMHLSRAWTYLKRCGR